VSGYNKSRRVSRSPGKEDATAATEKGKTNGGAFLERKKLANEESRVRGGRVGRPDVPKLEKTAPVKILQKRKVQHSFSCGQEKEEKKDEASRGRIKANSSGLKLEGVGAGSRQGGGLLGGSASVKRKVNSERVGSGGRELKGGRQDPHNLFWLGEGETRDRSERKE